MPVILISVADIAAATRLTPAAVLERLAVMKREPVAELHGEPLYIPATTHALLEALAIDPKKRRRRK